MLDLITELEALVDALVDDGIEYAVCGGLALGILGHPRMTKDIDVLISPEDLQRSLLAAKRVGFDVPARRTIFRQGSPTEQIMQRVSKIDEANNLLALDFLLATPVFETVWQTRVIAAYRDRTICVVSSEGLVTMKRLASRPQDLADIAALERLENPDDET